MADHNLAHRYPAIPAHDSASREAEWWLDRAVAQAVYALVARHDESGQRLRAHEIEALAGELGDVAYAELIFLLTRLRFDPADARLHWPRVVARTREIDVTFGQAVDIRVGLLSYFLDVDRHLVRPKVVEMDWVEWTAASALLDDVTGLPNQRFFRDQLGRETERSRREGLPLSLIVLDTDGFKRVNDTFGHQVGTETLRALGALLRAHAGDGCLVGRYGGDEFVVLLPSTSKADAARVAEVLRAAVEAHRIQTPDGPAPFGITMSAGVATCPGDAKDENALFVAADRALYQAKASGKNQVYLFGESTRSYARRRIAWRGYVEPAGSAGFPIETIEVGEGGFSFRSDRDVPTDTLLEASLTAPDGRTLRVAGRVVWKRALGPGLPEIAIRFVEAGRLARESLSEWISGHDGGTAPSLMEQFEASGA